MKLHIVHNAAGKIMAAASVASNSDNGPRPIAGKGQRELVLEVPSEHRGMSFLEICQSLRVDPKAKTLIVPRKQPNKKRK
jgi:hypothetical protein